MPLVLGDDGLDLGEFPDLMPEWGQVGPGEGLVTPPAGRRGEWYDPVAVVGRDERPDVLGVTGLAAPLLAGRLALHRGIGFDRSGCRREGTP